MATATPTPVKTPPSKVAMAAADQASMRAPLPSELTPAQRAQQGAKRASRIGIRGAGDQTTRSYTGGKGGGVWTNSNGTVLGRSSEEDSTIQPGKSTGDIPSPRPRRPLRPPPGR